jgi:signal transduction histidine kinase
MGFIFIIGLATNLITRETLIQTQQKVIMQRLANEASESYDKLQKNQAELNELNAQLQLRNNIFNHAEENSLIGSYAFHFNDNKLEYSDNLFRILGYVPGEFEPSFEKYLSFVHPDDKETLIQEWEESRRTKTFNMNVQRLIVKSGSTRYFKASGKFIGAGMETMLIGTLQDITHDVILNETLKEKNEELEKSNNELASFNYIASHDLQEPVRKIHAFSKLILERKDDELSETNKNYLSRISSAAVRMQNLIEAFLNYSRIDNAKLEFEKSDLNKLLEEAIAQVSDLIEDKQVKVEKETLPKLDVIPFQVQQLFINLISNSIKYSKPNVQPIIKITCEKVSGREIKSAEANAQALYWKIAVQDNGIGFDQKYVDKIFEVFKRLHTKEEYAGTGIGLAICRKIMQSHHGLITANGVQGEGAVFKCYFPVK